MTLLTLFLPFKIFVPCLLRPLLLFFKSKKPVDRFSHDYAHMVTGLYVIFLFRHRPVLGECLSSFAGCFPVAFMEPNLNKYNKYSILFGLEGKISEHSLEAQGNNHVG